MASTLEAMLANLFFVAIHFFVNRVSTPAGLISKLASPSQRHNSFGATRYFLGVGKRGLCCPPFFLDALLSAVLIDKNRSGYTSHKKALDDARALFVMPENKDQYFPTTGPPPNL